MNRRQTIPKHLRYTIEDFNRQFPNDDACLEHLKEQRFPGGVAYCETCQKDRKHHRITGRPVYSCDYCGTQISPMAGTIFQHSSTSLRLWYYAMYLMSSTRCGISAKQIQRETGVTYKTAWRMFRQIRTLLSEDVQLEGEAVEMDETYMGGKRKGRGGRPMRGDKVKTPVVGIAERKGGRVFASRYARCHEANAPQHRGREYLEKTSTVIQGALLLDFVAFFVESIFLFAAGWSLASGIKTFGYSESGEERKRGPAVIPAVCSVIHGVFDHLCRK